MAWVEVGSLWSIRSDLGSFLNGKDTQRTLCGSLDSTGLLQWLVFAPVPKGVATNLPVLCIPPWRSFYLLIRAALSVFLHLKCLYGCWLLAAGLFQAMLAPFKV